MVTLIRAERGARETLYAPAFSANGSKRRLCLGPDILTADCHGLIVSGEVEELALDLSAAVGLQQLELPDSVRLVSSPKGVEKTPWFRRQRGNAVYLGGYYCGTPGVPGGELVIREGTAAVACGADFHCRWRRIVLPESLKRIDRLAFADAPELEELHLPEGLEYIGDFAFQACPKLAELRLPLSLNSATAPFMLCTGLKRVTMAAGCPIKTRFSRCREIVLHG